MRVIPDDVWGALTVYAEARGEPYEGKVAVARVIRNRVTQGWEKDVAGVVLRPYQFSCFNTQDPNRLVAARVGSTDKQLQDSQAAWAESEHNDGGIGGAVMYYNPNGVHSTPSWASEDKYVATVGAHRFYTA